MSVLSTQLLSTLELLGKDDLQPGPCFERAHDICQQHEGVMPFDWIHALIHRIEGDDANAAYWYRCAGKIRHPGSIGRSGILFEEQLKSLDRDPSLCRT
ncbi:MAG: hypothetical protein ACR2O8_03470 [Rhizobiaceae bacterium]